MEKTSDVKTKILCVSEELFAKNGFDGTGIALIAEQAGITKSLLYYYFESKEKILEELFSKYLLSVVKEKDEIFASKMADEDAIRSSMKAGFRVLQSNKKIIRIMLSEVLKGNIDQHLVQQMLEPFVPQASAELKKSNGLIGVSQNFPMYTFFFGIGPIIMFMYFGGAWMKACNQNVDEFVDQYLSQMQNVFSNKITGVDRNFFEPYLPEIKDNLQKLL